MTELEYKGVKVIVTIDGYFEAETGTEKTYRRATFREVCDWVDKELTLKAKELKLSLSVVGTSGNDVRVATITGINRSTGRFTHTEKGVELYWLVPHTKPNVDLLAEYLESKRKTRELEAEVERRMVRTGCNGGISADEYPAALRVAEENYRKSLAASGAADGAAQ